MNTSLFVISILVVISLFTTTFTVTKVVSAHRSHKDKMRLTKQIMDNGKPAEAIVNFIRQTQSKLDDQPEVILDLTVTKDNGEVFHAAVKTFIPLILIPQFQKGKIIQVKYVEQEDQRKVAVEDAYLP